MLAEPVAWRDPLTASSKVNLPLEYCKIVERQRKDIKLLEPKTRQCP